MSAIHEHIAQERREHNGIYQLTDDKTGAELALEFVEIHQSVRKLQQDGRYFACTDFRRQGSQDEYYDIDFWLDDKSGKVAVGKEKDHTASPMALPTDWLPPVAMAMYCSPSIS
jgi:hypothetical protein